MSTLSPDVAPAAALAWSEDRLSRTDRPALAVWRPAGITAALGLAQRPEVELHEDTLRRDGIGLVRRQSGGGAVLLMPGVMCWEAWAPEADIAEREGDGGIRPAYRFLTSTVQYGLKMLGIDVVQAGVSDLSVRLGADTKKIAGTAQLRRRRAVLVHGSLLVAPNLGLLETYLRFPSSQPDYRVNRSHRDFCTSLAELLPDFPPEHLMATVCASIREATEQAGWTWEDLPATLTPEAEQLRLRKYSDPDWNWRKIRPTD